MPSNREQEKGWSGPAVSTGVTRAGGLPPALAPLATLADNAVNLRLLVEQLKSPVGVVPFVGAGMSVPFGFPGWRGFLEGMAPHAAVRDRVVGFLDQGQYEEAAEALLKARGANAFQTALEDTFGAHRLPVPLAEAAILQLPRLSAGPVLTTNFDPALEKVCENARRPFAKTILGMKVDALRAAFHGNQRVLVKLHGDAADRTDRVLTWSDYERAYGEREPLTAFLRFAMTRPLLFLGCSLGNDRTVRVLEALAAELRGRGSESLQTHYAVVERPSDEAQFTARHRRLTELGVRPVWYPAGKHELIADLLAHLAAQAGRSGVMGAVPREPPHYLLRDQELAALREALLAGDGGSLAITGRGHAVGVQGMGGVGKTVLAAALTRDPDVQRAYSDGIFWLTVGVQPTVLSLLNQLGGWFPGSSGPWTTEPEAQSRLRDALAGKRLLLILDDVWQLDHAAALHVVSAPGRLLVTTRNREILVGLEAKEFQVGVLPPDVALRMLADWAGETELTRLPAVAAKVAQECGYLPLPPGMVGAMVRLRAAPWTDALELLRGRDLDEFRRAFPDYPYPDLLRAVAVGVDNLEADDRERYLDLAVFPEDEPIPEGPLHVLWGMTAVKTRAVMARLVARSLASWQDQDGGGALVLHDLQGDYVRKVRQAELPRLHEHLLHGYGGHCGRPPVLPRRRVIRTAIRKGQSCVAWARGPSDGYFYQWLPWHLKEAGRSAELRRLLLAFDWLQAKLSATGVMGLLADFDHLPQDEEVRLVHSALRNSVHALEQDLRQLAGQLVGRLKSERSRDIQELVEEAAAWRGAAWLLPLRASLGPPATGLFRTIPGYCGIPEMHGLAMSADGRYVVFASTRWTLKAWDVHSGRELQTLQGHTAPITAVMVTANGQRALSASGDRFLKMWDLASGQEVRTITTNAWPVSSAALSRDGRRAVSGSWEGTLVLWDVECGRTVRTFERIGKVGGAVALSADGRRALFVGRSEERLHVWDIESGQAPQNLPGDAGWVSSVALSADGQRALSGAADGTIRVLDLQNRCQLRTLTGHSKAVSSLALSADGRLGVSGSYDQTLKVWDLESEREPLTLHGHGNQVTDVALSEDGYWVASASVDGTVRVWNVTSAWERSEFTGHAEWVSSVALSADGRLAASGSTDRTVKIWDLGANRELRTLQGHDSGVQTVALSADARRVVSGDKDGTLRVWDTETGRQLQTLRTHAGGVISAMLTSDGLRVVSGHDADEVLKVWDAASGKELRSFGGRCGFVGSTAVSPDGRWALSGYLGQTLVVWELERGQHLQTLKGHAGWVMAIVLSASSRWAISRTDDDSFKIWDLQRGEEKGTIKRVGWWFGGCHQLALPADGRWAASCAEDGTLKVWNFEDGGLIAQFTGDSGIGALAIAHDGRTIFAGEHSGRVHVLRLVLPTDPIAIRDQAGRRSDKAEERVQPGRRKPKQPSPARGRRIVPSASKPPLGDDGPRNRTPRRRSLPFKS